jgi:hypothetical protein
MFSKYLADDLRSHVEALINLCHQEASTERTGITSADY